MVAHQRPVAHHEDAIGDRKHLGEAMRHEQTRRAAVAVRSQSIEEAVRLVARQCGGRLVEDEDAGFLVESPGDDDELLAGEVERPDAGLGADVHAELVEHGPRRATHRQVVDEAPARRFVIEEQRLGDGEVRHDIDLLGYQHDPPALRIGHIGGAIRRSVDCQFAVVVLPEQSCQHADDRRLACPVLAEQGDDLTPLEVEGQIGDGQGLPERLAHPVHGEQVAWSAVQATCCAWGCFVLEWRRQHSGRSSGTLA